MRRLLAITCLLATLTGAPVFAQRGVAKAEARAAAANQRAKERETPIERWMRMTPEERRSALAKLPPERRREIQQKIERFRSLPPEERQQLRERYQTFSRLTPVQQNHARELFRQFNSLPEDRRPLVRQEYEQLRSMAPQERQTRMNSEEFKSKFAPSEQQMLHDLAQTFGTPQ